ncbi:MAG: hypothetical protein ACI9XP_001232 [Lentimonas sp.]|jgi:hypothetical protein
MIKISARFAIRDYTFIKHPTGQNQRKYKYLIKDI